MYEGLTAYDLHLLKLARNAQLAPRDPGSPIPAADMMFTAAATPYAVKGLLERLTAGMAGGGKW